ncbi:hypothetical protein [Brevundimonas sp.]|uniref:hypothetical protein n=1 Tax=Brevundimonas sp. TaxID=1871086 RepID=UPI0017DB2BF6|nr:hypothetical protein [Brevundimonas sp.]MBA4806390.1 hypothetical protein [Brevundimonas sp.]
MADQPRAPVIFSYIGTPRDAATRPVLLEFAPAKSNSRLGDNDVGHDYGGVSCDGSRSRHRSLCTLAAPTTISVHHFVSDLEESARWYRANAGLVNDSSMPISALPSSRWADPMSV